VEKIRTYIELFLLIFICTTFVYMEHPYKHTKANIQLVGHQQGCTCYRTARELTQKEKENIFCFAHASRNKLNIVTHL
jgi:hypothetical protein